MGYPGDMQHATVRIGESGLRTFEHIADRWGLSRSEREAILGIPRSTYARLRANPERANLDRNTLERLSHVFGIYKALHVLFSDDERADTWIDRPSTAFGGRSARERLTSGLVADLAGVRHHLDVARG
jgi:putative toxin-antitoxin system antitoxin component (TIGR02293 family)